MTDNVGEVAEFVQNNQEFLARVLVFGDTEAKSYALAAVANAKEVRDVERVEASLRKAKEDVRNP